MELQLIRRFKQFKTILINPHPHWFQIIFYYCYCFKLHLPCILTKKWRMLISLIVVEVAV